MLRKQAVSFISISLFILVGLNASFGFSAMAAVLHGSAFKQQRVGKPYSSQNPWVRKGDRLSLQFDLKAAEAQYQKALRRTPKDPGAHNGLGKLYTLQMTSSNQEIRDNAPALYEKAIAEFLTALRYQPNYVEAHLNLGTVYLEQGRLRDAGEEFERAYALAPWQSETNEKMGILALNEGSVNQAIPYLQKAIARNSRNSSAYYHLGEAYTIRGEYGKALDALQTSLYLYPNSAPVQHQLGIVYDLQGNGAAAIAAYKKALWIKPEFLEASLKLAEHYEKRGDLVLALEALKSAHEAQPQDNTLAFRIASLSLEAGQPDTAHRYYEKILGNTPDDAKAREGLSQSDLLLAQQQAQQGDFNRLGRAQDLVADSLTHNPDNLEAKLLQVKLAGIPKSREDYDRQTIAAILKHPAYTSGESLSRGELLLAQARFSEADQTFRDVLFSRPSAEEAVTVGEFCLHVGNPGLAREAFRRAETLTGAIQAAGHGLSVAEAQEAEAQLKVAQAQQFGRRNNSDQAILLLKQALRLNQKNAMAHKVLGELYEREEQPRLAIRHYQAYVNLEPSGEETRRVEAKLRKLLNTR